MISAWGFWVNWDNRLLLHSFGIVAWIFIWDDWKWLSAATTWSFVVTRHDCPPACHHVLLPTHRSPTGIPGIHLTTALVFESGRAPSLVHGTRPLSLRPSAHIQATLVKVRVPLVHRDPLMLGGTRRWVLRNHDAHHFDLVTVTRGLLKEDSSREREGWRDGGR